MSLLRATDPVVETIIGKLDALLDELGDILRAAQPVAAKPDPAVKRTAPATTKGQKQ